MKQIIPAARSFVIGAVVVGVLTLGPAGMAGAAISTATVPATAPGVAPSGSPTSSPARRARRFNCNRAPKALTRIQKMEANIAAGLPNLVAAEAKAVKAGHTHRADHLKRRMARLESAAYKNRLDKMAANVKARCKGAAAAV
jgi:hypothetical protein